ncbi:hypothetical protein PGT21_033510 [Puccinia graminis f. sp. tritici]|nr:hypothetical protein PGT21_033510 [Puccinia graminis f. sp. tritici]KAA1133279.1 hypothetical protein PGTUg99_018786 [Puccinia graminis f. sp. tritici]
MMPRVYVAKAEKDLRLMEQEKKAGKMRLTVDSDSSDSAVTIDQHPHSRRQPTKRAARRKSIPLSCSSDDSSRRATSSRIGTTESSHHQPWQQEPAGMSWGTRMCMRMNRSSSSTSQLLNPSRTLERTASHASSVSSRVSQNTSSRTSRVISQSRSNKLEHAISLKDDHALWRTYESANGRPALNLPPPGWRRESLADDQMEAELVQVPIWDFKDFTPDFGISRLPANLKITSQVGYLSDGHLLELIGLFDESTQDTIVDPVIIFEKTYSGFMTLEEWHDRLSSAADRIHDELSGWLAEDSGRSKDALTETGRWFKFMGRSITSVGFDDRLVESMVGWIEDFLVRVDDLAVDAVNRPEFSNLMLVTSWGIFELVCRLDLRHHRHPINSAPSLQTLLELGHRSLSNLLRRLLEYGPPVTMGKLKAHISNDDREGPLFDVSVEVWASLLNIILTPIGNGSKAEYLLIDNFWTKVIDGTRCHARRIELSQMACGEAVSYLAMMLCVISQILPNGETAEAGRIGAHWPVLVASLGKIPETILAETLEVRMRERRDRYVRSLFARILVFHERWRWELCFDDGMVERLYKILNAGRFERLSIELPEMNQRFGSVDSFPHLLEDLEYEELKQISSSEDLLFRLDTKMRTDDSCFGIFLKILVVGFKALPRPIEASKQKEIEKIISRCNPLRQLSFKPSRELGPTDPKITEQNRTSLVNHSALFLIYSILLPNTLKRQWSFLCNLYSFGSIDIPARSTHFKILCQFAKFLKPSSSFSPSTGIIHGFGRFEYLKIIVKKFSENLTLLKLEYSKLKERESVIQGRLSTPTHNSVGAAASSSTSRDIFKKDSVEHTTLRLELKEISDAITSRIRLITQILDSLLNLFSFYSHDLSRNDHHPWIYPSLIWLDSSWTVGLEESSLVKEKPVMSAFNNLICALLARRRDKMAEVMEDERRIQAIDERLGEACRAEVANGDELADDELVLQKSELKEQIQAVYRLDREFVERAVSTLPGPLTKSIEFLILDHHEQALDQEQDRFFSVGVQSIGVLGAIDRLKAALDPGFDWLNNFRSIERWLGAGLASRPSDPPHTRGKASLSNTHKNRNELRTLTLATTGLMGYLIGNVAGYYEEAAHLDQSHQVLPSSSTTTMTTALMRVYRGQVRLEVLKVWIDSLTFIEYTIQLAFSSFIVRLENDLHAQSASHPDQQIEELYGAFVPSSEDWNRWLVVHRILEPTGLPYLAPDCSLEKELDFLLNLASGASAFEAKRTEVFELIFGEMKKHLSRSILVTGVEEREKETISTEKYVRLYKEILGSLAESISTLNRRLVVFISIDSHSSSKDPQQRKTLLENQVARWKNKVKIIIHSLLSLDQNQNQNQNVMGIENPEQVVRLDQFFNFSSFPKLRILKSILGIA